MSVILETSLGDITIDLLVDACPKASRNFLKLCKVKYYNNVIFHSVEKAFLAQTGDPTGTGTGGESIYGRLYGAQAKYFTHETSPNITHSKRGTVGYVPCGTAANNGNGSMFYITLRDNLDFLDGKQTIFGEVAEGFDVLEQIEASYVDDSTFKPLKNIRIRHTIILDDPFDDPDMLEIPPDSPDPVNDPLDLDFVDSDADKKAKMTEEERVEELKANEAYGRAELLEIVSSDLFDRISD
jgi:peptidyl-prolyl cis-trans isomerase-like 4